MLTVAETVAAPSERVAASRRAPKHRPRTHLRQGWPLTGLLIGYPLWWVLGLAQILSLAAAALMLLELVRLGRIKTPRGFGIWLLFLAWLAVGVLLLQVDAHGTVHGTSNARYLTFCFRLAWYVAATIVLLYIGNMRRELSTQRLTRAFGWLFLTVVGGGILGTVAPYLQFPSALEVVLPRGLTSVTFVRDLIHPTVAQLNLVQGVQNPRTSAPFPYTNGWALNFALLLPFFLVSWFGPGAGWRRKVAPFVALVALFPVVVSVNRGLWISLIVMALFVAVRNAAFGHLRSLAATVGGACVIVALVLVTPLGATVEQRLGNGYSDDSRANLSETTVTTVAKTSPIVGLGTTRDVQGSFTSIAGGETESCPLCSPPSLGTQGHVWSLVFATGVGGALLYVSFMAVQLARGLRLRSRYATTGLVVIVAHAATAPFYDIIGIAMFTIMAGIGLLWRDHLDRPVAADPVRRTTPERGHLGGYASLVRANALLLTACALVGMIAAAAVQAERGPRYSADVSVLLPIEPDYPRPDGRPATLDTIAQTVRSSVVLDAIADATDASSAAIERDLEVTATPNTRILHITLQGPDAAAARRGADAAAETLIAERTKQLTRRKQTELDALDARESSLAKAVRTVDRAMADTLYEAEKPLDPLRYELITASTKVSADAARVAAAPLLAGSILSPAHSTPVQGVRNVMLTSGLMLGLSVGLALAIWRNARGPRMSRGSVRAETGLPVLIRLDRSDPAAVDHAARTVDPYAPTAWLAVGSDATAHVLARTLDDRMSAADETDSAQSVVLVAASSARTREVARAAASLRSAGVRAVGTVVLGGRPISTQTPMTTADRDYAESDNPELGKGIDGQPTS